MLSIELLSLEDENMIQSHLAELHKSFEGDHTGAGLEAVDVLDIDALYRMVNYVAFTLQMVFISESVG